MTKKEKEIVRGLASVLTRIQDSRDVEVLRPSVVHSAYILWQLYKDDIKCAESSLESFSIVKKL